MPRARVFRSSSPSPPPSLRLLTLFPLPFLSPLLFVGLYVRRRISKGRKSHILNAIAASEPIKPIRNKKLTDTQPSKVEWLESNVITAASGRVDTEAPDRLSFEVFLLPSRRLGLHDSGASFCYPVMQVKLRQTCRVLGHR